MKRIGYKCIPAILTVAMFTACSGGASSSGSFSTPASSAISTPQSESSSVPQTASSAIVASSQPETAPPAGTVADISEILSSEQATVYKRAEQTNRMFFIDAFAIEDFYDKQLLTQDTEEFELNGSKNTYYYADLDWNQFEADMLQIFTPECFKAINTRFISAQDNLVLCMYASSSISRDFQDVAGYELVSSNAKEVRFNVLANYADESTGATQVKKFPICLSNTSDGWRVSEFSSMYTG